MRKSQETESTDFAIEPIRAEPRHGYQVRALYQFVSGRRGTVKSITYPATLMTIKNPEKTASQLTSGPGSLQHMCAANSKCIPAKASGASVASMMPVRRSSESAPVPG